MGPCAPNSDSHSTIESIDDIGRLGMNDVWLCAVLMYNNMLGVTTRHFVPSVPNPTDASLMAEDGKRRDAEKEICE